MRPPIRQLLAALLLLLAVMLGSLTIPAGAATPQIVRLGYLDQPGSALCRIAAAQGHFREEGLQVELVRFADSASGLSALQAGRLDVGVFAIAETLRVIATGTGFRIIAGGGTQAFNNPLVELDDTLRAENEGRGIVVLTAAGGPATGKETLVRLTAALIRAYRTQRLHLQTGPASLDRSVHFDPNPDYYRLERIWRGLGLQDSALPRDYLASHVYEEIYCDALDRLRDNAADDLVYQELSGKAVCTPDCCPLTAARK